MPTRPRLAPEQLRSHRWFGPDDLRSFGHRSRLKQMGFAAGDWAGKPVVGILNTWSDMNTCHTHFKQRVEEVKRGVWQAGGFPVEIPVVSLSETFMKPSSMFYRNLLAMEAEEVLRCHPVDVAVLMGGCDKTTPALIMGAISANLPAIFFPCGPMIAGNWKGTKLGSGTDAWKYWAERGAGNIDECQWREIEDGIARSPGHCMTMGTASTMGAIAETLGLTLTGASSIPAVHSGHSRLATATGRRAVEMAWENLKITDVLTADSFDNAITVDMAIGGSTNAIIHLIAMAGRAGVSLDLERFDQISQRTPVIANLRPSGKYLMEDFHDAGGLPELLSRIPNLLKRDCLTVTGKTLGENIDAICPDATSRIAERGARVEGRTPANPPDATTPPNPQFAIRNPQSTDTPDDVILWPDQPLAQAGATFVLRGNLAPDGCVIKPTAAEPRLLEHTGPALVFKDYADLKKRIDDEALPVTADTVIVLQSAGPVGAPGIPEWGMLPIPKKLLKQGVRDMVRISDARMSGTSYGTCVLHVSPESAAGGPFALVRDGDLIDLDVPARKIHLRVSDADLAERRKQWKPPEPRFDRGYGKLFCAECTQAHEGCDFKFLHATNGKPTPEPDIY
ncbi:MAG: IlvD/Edd family dehydratase [Phycisphaerae bacterium]|nr:IlvD/Edd family dehydratase [Tepidisphaeraceae bacterium]